MTALIIKAPAFTPTGPDDVPDFGPGFGEGKPRQIDPPNSTTNVWIAYFPRGHMLLSPIDPTTWWADTSNGLDWQTELAHMTVVPLEAALRDGETWIAGQNPVPNAVAACGAPPCAVVVLDSLGDLTAQNNTWWNTNAHEYGTTGTQDITEVSTDPRYIVEFRTFQNTGGLDVGLNPPEGRNYYRLTARGTGGNTTTETLLQSHFMVVAN